jgi:SAM-dependent methyltransferase
MADRIGDTPGAGSTLDRPGQRIVADRLSCEPTGSWRSEAFSAACSQAAVHDYDRIADWYCRTRSCEVGVADVERVLSELPAGARALDAGCGDGRPIAVLLARRGCAVTGIDSSRLLLDRFIANVPEAEAVFGDISTHPLPRRAFDFVVCWGCLFHLEEDGQTLALGNLAAALRPGGQLLFTSGADAGLREGSMDGVRLRYRSLGRDRYRKLVEDLGLDFIEDYADPQQNHVYRFAKSG